MGLGDGAVSRLVASVTLAHLCKSGSPNSRSIPARCALSPECWCAAHVETLHFFVTNRHDAPNRSLNWFTEFWTSATAGWANLRSVPEGSTSPALQPKARSAARNQYAPHRVRLRRFVRRHAGQQFAADFESRRAVHCAVFHARQSEGNRTHSFESNPLSRHIGFLPNPNRRLMAWFTTTTRADLRSSRTTP